METEAGN